MSFKTILLKGDPDHKEAPAGGTITPGDVVALNSSGQIIRAAELGGTVGSARVAKRFAIENELIGNDLDIDYSSGDNALYVTADSGDEINGLVATSAAAIVIGDPVKNDGSGKLVKATAVTDNSVIIGWAMEAVDNSAGATAVRLRIEVA